MHLQSTLVTIAAIIAVPLGAYLLCLLMACWAAYRGRGTPPSEWE